MVVAVAVSLGAQWDEQSEHWHTSRRHVNSNQHSLSINTLLSQMADATATRPLQNCPLSQMNRQSWPHRYSFVPLISSRCEHMLQWRIQTTEQKRTWLKGASRGMESRASIVVSSGPHCSTEKIWRTRTFPLNYYCISSQYLDREPERRKPFGNFL